MKIYIAGHGMFGFCKAMDFFEFNRLVTFYDIERRELHYFDRYKSLMIDSGAFTFLKGKRDVDWTQYVLDYANFINKHNIDLFIELDIDNIAGLRKVEDLRKLLEDKTGKQCIPVWHKSRGKEYWLKMIEEYSYVAIGWGEYKTRMIAERKKFLPYLPYFLKEAKRHNCKVHGLGFTSFGKYKQIHFDSVDSTSWLAGQRFGYVYKFDGKELQKINRAGKRIVPEARAHNFLQYIKYIKYMENKFNNDGGADVLH